MAEDGDKWRKYVDGVANPRIEDGKRTEWNIDFFSASLILPVLTIYALKPIKIVIFGKLNNPHDVLHRLLPSLCDSSS